MRAVILALFILIHTLIANTQNSQIFLRGAINIASISSISSDNFSEVNSVISFNAGLLAKLPLGKKIALQPALLFSGKGAKTKGGEPPFTTQYFNASTRPYYLELPVNIVFGVTLKEKKSLFFGAGFYGALGIAGKNKIDGYSASTGPYNDEKKIDFGKGENAFPNFHTYAGIGYMTKEDYGLTATAGIHFKKLLFSLDYGYGLKNIGRGPRANKDENKNRALSISIGYQVN